MNYYIIAWFLLLGASISYMIHQELKQMREQ